MTATQPTFTAPRQPLPPAVIAARHATCRACDRYLPETDRCRICGCSATQTHRAASPWQNCHDGKWEKL